MHYISVYQKKISFKIRRQNIMLLFYYLIPAKIYVQLVIPGYVFFSLGYFVRSIYTIFARTRSTNYENRCAAN